MYNSVRHTLFSATVIAALSPLASAETPWAQAKVPSEGKPESIGGYSKGCVKGAVALPAQGPGFQVMRRKRLRYFGHPQLINFVRSFGKEAKKRSVGPILVGDLGQPMGGPSPHGHSSHQSGLDVDIWLWHPPIAKKRLLRDRERETLGAKRVVHPKKHFFTKFWSEDVAERLRIAALQPGVSRVLVNPAIKRRLCEEEKGDRSYLRKLRPWYGHADHMHVRLDCPKDSPDCEPQKELPIGDGCDQLDWWFDEEAQAARREGQKKYQSTVGATPVLPARCDELIAD